VLNATLNFHSLIIEVQLRKNPISQVNFTIGLHVQVIRLVLNSRTNNSWFGHDLVLNYKYIKNLKVTSFIHFALLLFLFSILSALPKWFLLYLVFLE